MQGVARYGHASDHPGWLTGSGASRPCCPIYVLRATVQPSLTIRHLRILDALVGAWLGVSPAVYDLAVRDVQPPFMARHHLRVINALVDAGLVVSLVTMPVLISSQHLSGDGEKPLAGSTGSSGTSSSVSCVVATAHVSGVVQIWDTRLGTMSLIATISPPSPKDGACR